MCLRLAAPRGKRRSDVANSGCPGSSRHPRVSRTARCWLSRLGLGVGLVGMAGLIACTPSVAGASGKNGSGFTNGEVRLAASYPVNLVGPTDMLGLQAYFNYVNRTSGGVKMANGKKYKIVFKYLTDAYTTGRAVANVKTFLANFHPAAIVGLLGSAANQATIGILDRAKVPDLYSIQGFDYWETHIRQLPMMGPTSQPSDNLWVASEINYVKKKFPHAKVAVLLQNTAYGQDVKNAIAHDIAGTGLKVATTQFYNVGAPTVSTQIAKLASSGATVFLDFSLIPALTQDIEYMHTIGWHPAHFVCYNCANSVTLGPAGAAANGIYAPLTFVTPSAPQWSKLPAIIKLKKVVTKYGPLGIKVTEPSLEGAAIGELLVANLKASQPNSQSLMHVVRTQHGGKFALLIPGASVDTSPKYPYLVNKLRIAQFNYSADKWIYKAPAFIDPTYKK